MKKTVSFLILLMVLTGYTQTQRPTIHFCGNADNDLYRVLLAEENLNVIRYDNPETAVDGTPQGGALIIAADEYGIYDSIEKEYRWQRNSIPQEVYTKVNDRNIKLYIEYPETDVPGVMTVTSTDHDIPRLNRGVVNENINVFGEGLPPRSILGINNCRVVGVGSLNYTPFIVIGRVAGFDSAIYGLGDVNTRPVLIKGGNTVVATTKLTNFRTARYGPHASWKIVWETILGWLTEETIQLNTWSSARDIVPMYEKNEPLPDDVLRTSISKGVEWYYNGRFFVHPDWKKIWLDNNTYTPLGTPLDQNLPNGDGTLGILEGQGTKILVDGPQQYRYWVRADVQGEAAYTLAMGGDFLQRPDYLQQAENIGDFLFFSEDSPIRTDPQAADYGLIGWRWGGQTNVHYGDDNARLILGMIGASARLGTNKWNKEITRNILSNFRLSSRQGFQSTDHTFEAINENGWRHYFDRDYQRFQPHFEMWLPALYLWLYDKIAYKPLLEKARTAIRLTMEAYPSTEDFPHSWRSTNGFQQERARMVLPLAWLVRVEDTEQHRQWLDTIVSDILEDQDSSGAIREELGRINNYGFDPPYTNAQYSGAEAPLNITNNDPVSDMLYTCNFAFFALNEAAHATGNSRYYEAVAKLSEFLARIQVNVPEEAKQKNDKLNALDGAWFRAFDYNRWDYWGSDSDTNWGAWGTLTGWIQTWIVTTQALVEEQNSYWDLTDNLDIAENANDIINFMMEEEPNVIDSKAYGARSVRAADIDGDGDMDVLSASANAQHNNINWYENLGEGEFKNHLISRHAEGARSVHAADLDGDGDTDVLSASYDSNKIAWYRNDGTGRFTKHFFISRHAEGATSVYTADLDGDGDLDVLSASKESDKIAWYQNDGTGKFPKHHFISRHAEGASSVYAADLDGDGDMDVLSASELSDKIAWYENDGSGRFRKHHFITRRADGASSVRAVDLDGDGDLDVLSASYLDDKIAWYENDGHGNFPKHHFISRSADGAASVHAVDLDGDGDMDVLSASFLDDTIAWYENLGGGNFGNLRTSQRIINSNADSAISVYTADLNGDGDPEILSASFRDNKIAWYYNPVDRKNPGITGPDKKVISKVAGGARSIHTADLDDDGDKDVISAHYGDDKIVWFKNKDGKGNFDFRAGNPYSNQNVIAATVIDAVTKDTIVKVNGVTSVYAARLNDDNHTDILSSSYHDNKIAWYGNDGNGNFGEQQIISTDAKGAMTVHATDLDGDGDQDVLSASYNDDKIAWYKNDGDGNFGEQQIISTDAKGAMAVHVADLDGDGNQDVLSASYNDNKIAWYKNDGHGNFTDQANISNPFEAKDFISATAMGATSIYAADLDNDGDMDVLAASAGNNTIAWYENRIKPFGLISGIRIRIWVEHKISITALGASSVRAVDLDNDGDMDVVATSQKDNTVAWYENLGRGYFGDPSTNEKLISKDADGARWVHTEDLDGDGYPDVLSASSGDHTIAWYKNNREGGFSEKFISTWKTTTTNEKIRLPLVETGSYNFTVNWGDGSSNKITAWDQDAVTHTYTGPGDYTVTISGEIDGWSFKDNDSREKITEISSWGSLRLGRNEGHFYKCTNLEITAPDLLNTSGTISFKNAFRKASTTLIPRIEDWDTSEVTNMGSMFTEAPEFNQDIGNWDVGKVTNMAFMFHGAVNFDQNIGNWDIRRVIDMNSMFGREAGLSNENYNALLEGWGAQEVQQNVVFDAGNSTYTIGSPAEIARTNLIENDGWRITDGGGVGGDNTAPTITNVTSDAPDGDANVYRANDRIQIQIVFSEPVTVTGTPQLTLETGDNDQIINYTSGSGNNTLTFTYTVQTGDFSNDLDYASTQALTLGDGIRIKDPAGNDASLTLPWPGDPHSLRANKDLIVNALPTVTLSVDKTQIPETDGVATLTASLSAVSTTNVEVDLLYSGTASRGTDYDAPETINIPARETEAGISISAIHDTAVEGDETIIVEISSVNNGIEEEELQQFIIVISDDDLPTISFANSDSSAYEDTGSADVEVSLSNIVEREVSVEYTVTGTATQGTDYTLGNGTLTFSAGSLSQSISITDIIDDNIVETDETIIITLSNPSSDVSLGTGNQHTYTILNNDIAEVTIEDVSVSEDEGPVMLNAILDRPVDGGFEVRLSTYNGTAMSDSDYTPVNMLLTFEGMEGETKSISIPLINDMEKEGSKDLTVLMSDLTAHSVSENHIDITDMATVTIIDDDNKLPEVINNIEDQKLTEGSESAPIALANVFTDKDDPDEELSFSADYNRDIMAVYFIPSNEGVPQLVLKGIGTGETEVTLTATDPHGASKDLSFKVEVRGCALHGLAANNFQLQTSGETCTDKNNGAIAITVEQEESYTARIGDRSYEFTGELKVGDLSPGTYDVCISLQEPPDCKQCFEVEIAEAQQLSGRTTISETNGVADKLSVEISSGTAPYSVQINDRPAGRYHTNRFSLAVQQGDKIEVTSGVACEGKLLLETPWSEELLVYPNPTGSDVELVLPRDRTSITAAIYNVSGVKVSSKTYAVSNRKAVIGMKKLPAGVYFLHLGNKNPTIVKIIKE
ncbi:BspA family leucine-rich repeat surface protein [Leptobacterium flavescens]|uniref:BspA family leucine-rich repeat surface protein n=1 Tax=Leptobacterium flavescens TaxID=472055 RepID=A0A6P0UKE8_9FLAO|nr:FG-GAP-like repeat-containing protein [Leptobacterium flavescens]NER13775.1 BspA family leucine-rich repeat surface protein [Leptobacterium flavescens]